MRASLFLYATKRTSGISCLSFRAFRCEREAAVMLSASRGARPIPPRPFAAAGASAGFRLLSVNGEGAGGGRPSPDTTGVASPNWTLTSTLTSKVTSTETAAIAATDKRPAGRPRARAPPAWATVSEVGCSLPAVLGLSPELLGECCRPCIFVLLLMYRVSAAGTLPGQWPGP